MTTVATDIRRGVNAGIAFKVPCKVATTANITLSGLQTIDGVSVVADDRVLVKDQTTASENGIYVASSSTWSRAQDWNGAFDVAQGTLVRINQGSVNAGMLYAVSTSDPITIGTTSVSFTLDSLVKGIPLVAQGSETSLLASWAGKCVQLTTGITVDASVHAPGDAITVQNTTASDVTLTQGSGFTLRLSGSGTTGSRTIAQYGECTLHFVSATEAYMFGSGLS